jgi:beta-phosphoglucomutase-like phosphatase (HAD superfamily)
MKLYESISKITLKMSGYEVDLDLDIICNILEKHPEIIQAIIKKQIKKHEQRIKYFNCKISKDECRMLKISLNDIKNENKDDDLKQFEYFLKINKKLSDKTIYNILKALENLKRKNIDYKNISNNEIVKLKLNKSKAYAIKKFNEFKMVK